MKITRVISLSTSRFLFSIARTEAEYLNFVLTEKFIKVNENSHFDEIFMATDCKSESLIFLIIEKSALFVPHLVSLQVSGILDIEDLT